MKNYSKKIKRTRGALILSALFFVATLAMATYTSISLAWFSTNRQASVNFSSMKVEGGLEASLKYCAYNRSDSEVGYMKSRLTSEKLSTDNKAYDDLFLTPSDSKSELSLSGIAPLYCSSYVVEVNNPTSSSINFGMYLLSYEEKVLATKVDKDNTTTGEGAVTAYISIARAMRVYTSFSTSASPLSDARTFLASSFYTDGAENAGKFSHDEAVTEASNRRINTLADPECWNPAADDSLLTLDSMAKGYLFISVYFSDDSSTYYNLDSSTTTDEVTTSYYSKSTTGNSNCYQGLSIAFSSLLIA